MKTIIGIYVRMIYAYRALKAIRQPHLGDKVYFRGRWHFLNQGVNAPYWDLWQPCTRTMEHSIPESKFELQPLYRRFWFSFRFTYRFYMRSWFQIDVKNGISTSRRIVIRKNWNLNDN